MDITRIEKYSFENSSLKVTLLLAFFHYRFCEKKKICTKFSRNPPIEMLVLELLVGAEIEIGKQRGTSPIK